LHWLKTSPSDGNTMAELRDTVGRQVAEYLPSKTERQLRVVAMAERSGVLHRWERVGRFTDRIQALAANQDWLVRNEWQGVDLENWVRAQLAHFADFVGPRIAVQGPKLRLNAAAAQGIGLTMHELATNTGKCGALSTDRGRVDLCWRTDNDTLTISRTERSGPPVSPPERRGSAARSSLRWRRRPSAARSIAFLRPLPFDK
jgi:two-component sensor histidine kinase